MTNIETIRNYHQRTKHKLGAYARGPEYLDWENQPDPFRSFSGAAQIPLPFASDPVGELAPLNLANVAKLLELSMGLSAWKQYGPDRWALRCNPSSGNLHPTEAYVVAHQVTDLADGVYHYAPREHVLEHRAALSGGSSSSYCFLGLSSIAWREAWKYGERAYRYVQLDVGHALGAIRYAAAVLGWRIRLLSASDASISDLLGLSRDSDFADAEREYADLLLQICCDEHSTVTELPDTHTWQGKANSLGGDPYLQWPIIAEAHHACVQDSPDFAEPSPTEQLPPESVARYTEVIRQRRSAQSFIGKQSGIVLSHFEQFLRALMPEERAVPLDTWCVPQLHIVLFVHRVEGLSPGLYVLPRCAQAIDKLQAAFGKDFHWQNTDISSDSLPLFKLLEGDMRKTARALSCHQEIASASGFSFAMLAAFDDALESSGAAAYKHLHWEAGLLGQVAYLQAELMGMRGTGIGCFFDDSVHMSLGLENTEWQSVYHFTVGKPRLDARLETLPPYAHLQQRLSK